MTTWLSKSWKSRMIAGQGRMAIPYIHINCITDILYRVIDRTDRLSKLNIFLASSDKPVSLLELFQLSHSSTASDKKVHVGFTTRFGVIDLVFARPQQSRHVGVRIIEITKVETACGTNLDTRRLLTFLDAVQTKRALVDIAIGVDVTGVIRTRGDARLAPRALVVCDQHHTTLVHVACPGRACIDAR